MQLLQGQALFAAYDSIDNNINFSFYQLHVVVWFATAFLKTCIFLKTSCTFSLRSLAKFDTAKNKVLLYSFDVRCEREHGFL